MYSITIKHDYLRNVYDLLLSELSARNSGKILELGIRAKTHNQNYARICRSLTLNLT